MNPGELLGPYRVLDKLGEGGMGEVYKARDTRLDRSVAIKVLAEAAIIDPDRRRRFEQEARAASSLTHPHICALYDVGSAPISRGPGLPAATFDYLVMEYLEGQSLAERLADKGPLPVEQALLVATQIADALACAHKQGIVHRDLKPANVMLIRSPSAGQSGPHAKLLDFGLAKLRQEVAEPIAASSLVTLEPMTGPGIVLGTVPYMAPEQLEGKDADARSDIFSFGAVIYEMLTGRRPFEGSSQASIIAAILDRDPPPVSTLSPLTPPGLDRLVRKCLAKAPDARWQSASDVADELRWLAAGSGGVAALALDRAKVPGRSRHAPWRVTTLLGVLLLGALGGVLATWRLASGPQPASSRISQRLAIDLPADMPLAPAGLVSPAQDRPALALSRDGTRLAYVALVGGRTQICLRDMRTGLVAPVDQAIGGHTPFFSPDGQSMAFFADNKLKRVPVGGGAATVLADAPYPWGATWGTDDTIYFNRFEGEGIFRVSANGGGVQPVVTDYATMPEFVGSGPGLFVTAGRIRYHPLNDPAAGRPILSGQRSRYLPTGHLLYNVGSRIMAVPLERSAMTAAGDPLTLVQDLRTADYGVAQFTASEEGTLVYVPGRPQGRTTFVRVDRQGRQEPFGLPENQYGAFAVSPDGARLAYSLDGEIWIWDFARRQSSRLTPRVAAGDPWRNSYPRWTPDGKHVVFNSSQAGSGGVSQRLMAVAVDTGAVTELVPASGTTWFPSSFAPDGSVLSLFSRAKDSSFDLYLLRVATSDGLLRAVGGPEIFLQTRFGECFGNISPDGRWMLFSSDRNGTYEAWVTTYPKAGPMIRVSEGREAMWNRSIPNEAVVVDGRAMYALNLGRDPAKAGERRLLFEGAYPDVPGFGYDTTPDGRFVMLENKDILRPTTTLQVVTNLFDELQRRAPVRK